MKGLGLFEVMGKSHFWTLRQSLGVQKSTRKNRLFYTIFVLDHLFLYFFEDFYLPT